jgi:prepilin-type processing-associated H-X9-DG protein
LPVLVVDEKLLRCPAENLGLFALEGSSYEWNPVLNGKPQDGTIENMLGPSRTPMLYDMESVHPDKGEGSWRGKNVVFCDGSVSN